MKRYFLILFFLFSCIDTPQAPENGNGNNTGGFLVVNEGLWGQSNSSITYINDMTGETISNYFANANKGITPGDLANDILVKGDTALLIMNSEDLLILFDCNTGEYYNEIKLPDGSSPREGELYQDSILFISNLYGNSVSVINITTNEIIQNIETGPNPEGLELIENKLFVCNSGLGEINKDIPLAGTVSIYDLNNFNFLESAFIGPNLTEVLYNQNNKRIYFCYLNFFSDDSLGGIVEYDLSLNKLREWKTQASSLVISELENRLYFIEQSISGISEEHYSRVSYISLSDNNAEIINFVENDNNNDYWYSLYFDNISNRIFVGNARNYQVNGEILIYDAISANLLKRYKVGINPTKVIYFGN